MMRDLLFQPGPTFRTLAKANDPRVSLLRGPLRLLFFLACLVSFLASGTLNLRLLTDGAISFAFVPIIQVAALACTGRSAPRPSLTFTRRVDLFFAGFVPWLLWIIVVGAVLAIVPPQAQGDWLKPIAIGCLLPLLWSLWIDFNFFRQVGPRTERGAMVDLLVQRGIGWTATLGYFLGVAAWPEFWWLISKVRS